MNKTNYEACNDKDFISNITKGGRDVVQLKEARPYYFLSSGGYCWSGMKLAIIVQETTPSPAPIEANVSSQLKTYYGIVLATALLLGSLAIGLFN